MQYGLVRGESHREAVSQLNVVCNDYRFVADTNPTTPNNNLIYVFESDTKKIYYPERIYRPLTFKETIEAKLNDFERLSNPDGTPRRLSERLRLFTEESLSTCSAIMQSPKDPRKFKIIPLFDKLLDTTNYICDYGRCNSLGLEYAEVASTELNLDNESYNSELTEKEAKEHLGWLEALEGDTNLLRAYTELIFSLKRGGHFCGSDIHEGAMKFQISEDPKTDIAIPLIIGTIHNGLASLIFANHSGYSTKNYTVFINRISKKI